MKRRWIAIAVIVLLGLLMLLLPRSYDVAPPAADPEPAPVAEAETFSTPSVDDVAPAAVPTPDATKAAAAAAPPLQLTAILRGTNPSQTRAVRARIAIMRVNQVDLAEYRLALQEGVEGAGPTSILDLAHLVEWLDVEPHPTEAGLQKIGPVEVPPADKYRIVAWQADHEYFATDFIPPAEPPHDGIMDAGTIEGHAPTVLRIRFINPLPGQHEILAALGRAPHAEPDFHTHAVLHIMETVRPDLHDALFEDAPLVLPVDGASMLSPLPPNENFSLRLSTLHGVQAEPLEVELQNERITEVVLDLSEIFRDDDALALHVSGRLLFDPSGDPIEGAIIRCTTCPIQYEETTDADGAFTFPALPVSADSSFEATLPEFESPRPLSAPSRVFTIEQHEAAAAPEGDTPHERRLSVEWSIPAYRWVVLQLPEDPAHPANAAGERPFPIHILQAFDEEADIWRMRGAQEFLPEGNRLAISVSRPGIYRTLTAVSPLEIYPSDPADLGPDDREVVVRLDSGQLAAAQEVFLDLRRDGLPLGGAAVFARSLYSSLPSKETISDHFGRVPLGMVGVEEIYVEIYKDNVLFFEGTLDLRRLEGNTIRIDGASNQ